MSTKAYIKEPLVSVEWLAKNVRASNLVMLHATLQQVTEDTKQHQGTGIKNARIFDIKNTFSETTSPLPNTMLSAEKFQEQARLLGINKDTAIVVYDTVGMYASPRVWWMFKAMGHTNIAVLDGGLPAWIAKGYEITSIHNTSVVTSGDFEANFNPGYFVDSSEVLDAISNNNIGIADARSYDRFMGLVDEPREGLRAGHIPNSKNIPYTELQEEGKMISKERLQSIFTDDYIEKEQVIFSCGSGITACILALGAEVSGVKNLSVYDGSWTDWGSNHTLPIQKK